MDIRCCCLVICSASSVLIYQVIHSLLRVFQRSKVALILSRPSVSIYLFIVITRLFYCQTYQNILCIYYSFIVLYNMVSSVIICFSYPPPQKKKPPAERAPFFWFFGASSIALLLLCCSPFWKAPPLLEFILFGVLFAIFGWSQFGSTFWIQSEAELFDH